MDHISQLKEKFKEVLNYLREEFSGLRTNQPTPKLLDMVKVDYFGTPTPLRSIASISIEPPRCLIVSPWDRNALPLVQKAIDDAKLSVGTAVQGAIVRVTLPDLTNERRAELMKVVKSTAEEARIKMRRERDEIQKQINTLTEDEKFRAKDAMQKQVDIFNKEVTEMVQKKEAEINE